MSLERDFQHELIQELKHEFPGCIVLKNDPTYIQGIPDLLILYGNKWAALECKTNPKSSIRPNQMYYVTEMNRMSYASFVSPQTKVDVLYQLQAYFGKEF